MSGLCGGLGTDKPADNEIHDILAKIRDEVETKLGRFQHFVAESYRSQLVNGINYFVKVHTGDEDKRLHLRIYKPFNGEPEFVSHVSDVKKTDPINYF